MRCGCPQCGDFMVNSEHSDCVCPSCGYRCNACLGTNTLLNKDDILALRQGRLPRLVLGRDVGQTLPDSDDLP